MREADILQKLTEHTADGGQPPRFFQKMGNQVVVIFGLGLALMVATLVGFNYVERYQSLTSHLEAEGRIATVSISDSCAHYIPLGDLAAIEQMLVYFGADPDVQQIRITDEKGALLNKIVRGDGGKIKVQYEQASVPLPPVAGFTRVAHDDYIAFWMPVNGDRLVGWVNVDYSMARLSEARLASLKEAIISGVFAFLAGVLLLHFFIKPRLAVINRAARNVQHMGKSPHDILPVDHLSVETQLLTAALNRASAELFRQTEQIRQDRERIRLLLDSVPVAIFGTDLRGDCIFHNPLCASLCGYPPTADLLGMPLTELIADDTIAPAVVPATVHRESLLRKQDGTQSPCELWMHPMLRGDAHVGYLISFVDISERRNAELQKNNLENQLQKSQRMQAIGQLTGGIAHDFNNILTAVLGYTRLAIQRTTDLADDNLQVYLGEVLLGAERAGKLVKQMLAFGRADSGTPCPTRPVDAVNETMGMIRPILPATVAMSARCDDARFAINVDPVHLQQVLMNFLLNANDAMHGKGKIEIAVTRRDFAQCQCVACHQTFTGRYVSIQVKDTGTGIDPQIIDRIFEPFFSTKEVGKGTGMGLSMVHGLVHKNNGHLLLHSVRDQGSTFEVLFPLQEYIIDEKTTDAIDASLLLPDTTGDKGKAARILVVDDEVSVARFMSDLLQTVGYEISMETSSVAAYEKFMLEPASFDLVVTDQTMPNITGYELADRFLKQRPELPIILCTGYSELVSREKALQLGIRYYFEKPVDVRQFCATVESLLAS